MALEAFSDSKYQFAFSSGVLNQVTGDTMQPSSSNHLLQNDGQYQAVVASLLNASSGNLSGSAANMNEGMVTGLRNQTIVQETTNYRLSRFSSLLPNSNSAVSMGPQSHRSASADMYSYLNLPPLPVFSSHSLSSTGSSNTDGSSLMQQTSHLGINSSQPRKRKQQQRGFSATSPPDLQRRQSSSSNGKKLDISASTEVHKKPRLNTLQLRSKSEQQNVLQSTPQFGVVDIDKLQQQQMRQHQLQQAMHQVPAAYALHSGVCSRRIMQYMYHLRHRPSDNGIAYWRKFVAEYYAPCAKKRWCFSMYDNAGHHAFGFFPKSAVDAWQCDLCGSKPGRGFEANLEALPRLNKVMFESGVIDELLYLDMPHERVQFSGLMILEYGKAVQETVFEQCRVVREGKLRIVFTPDLKILSWEFCAWQPEEFLPRNLVAPQVSQLVQTAQNYESTIYSSGSDGATPHDLQANCNMFLVAGCQLARNTELDLVDDFGFPKRYVRSLQIAEIVNTMKDLITFSLNCNTGPIESLKNYSCEASTSKPLKDESLEKRSAHGLLNDGRKLVAASPVADKSENGSSSFTGCGSLASCEGAILSPGYYERLLGHNSFSSKLSKVKQEPSPSYKSGASSKSFQCPKTLQSGLVQNFSVDGMSSFDSSECNQKKTTEERLIRRLLQEMINNSRTNGNSEVEKVNHKTTSNKNSGFPAIAIVSDVDRNMMEFRNNGSSPFPSNAESGNVGKLSSFTSASGMLPSDNYSNDNFIRRDQYLPEVIQSMAYGYYDNRTPDGGGGQRRR